MWKCISVCVCVVGEYAFSTLGCVPIGRDPQRLSSKSLLKGFLLLSMREAADVEQALSVTSEKPAGLGRPFSPKRRAGLRSPMPQEAMPCLGSVPEFVNVWLLDPTVNSYGRNRLALCLVPLPLPQTEGGVSGESSPQGMPGSSAITSVLLQFARKGRPCHLPLQGMRVAGPLRGHAWPGGCDSTSKFMITAIPTCLTGSSSLENCVAVSSSRQHHLVPPSSHAHCYRLLLCTEVISHDQMLSFPSGRVLWSELGSSPMLQAFRSSFQAPPHTSSYILCPCATPIHVGDCVYLPLGCLVKESFPRVC